MLTRFLVDFKIIFDPPSSCDFDICLVCMCWFVLLQSLMFSSREDTRVSAAELYALTVVYGEGKDKQLALVSELTQCVTSQVSTLRVVYG